MSARSPISRKSLLFIIAAAAGIVVLASWNALSTTPLAAKISNDGKVQESGGTNRTVPADRIVSGGPPRDGIPSIDNPKFVSAEDAEFLQDSDFVVGLEINGDSRTYPLQILVWHEIVNDNVGGVPVSVTYCPLCFTTQIFDRTIEGQVVEFGTSGKLYKSNLVMYDRTSESLWSQGLGEGLAGKYAGRELDRIPFDLAKWKEWKQVYPDTRVLSTNTGFARPYGADPYGNYYTSEQLYFPVENRDGRLALKQVVVGIENEGQFKAYRVDNIEKEKVINDELGERPLALVSLHPFMVRAFDRTVAGQTLEFEYDPEGNRIVDKQTASIWNFDGQAVEGQMKGKNLTRLPLDEGFWFSWVAFHPETGLYDSNQDGLN